MKNTKKKGPRNHRPPVLQYGAAHASRPIKLFAIVWCLIIVAIAWQASFRYRVRPGIVRVPPLPRFTHSVRLSIDQGRIWFEWQTSPIFWGDKPRWLYGVQVTRIQTLDDPWRWALKRSEYGIECAGFELGRGVDMSTGVWTQTDMWLTIPFWFVTGLLAIAAIIQIKRRRALGAVTGQ